MMYQQINDEGATPAERLGALREYLATGPAFPDFVPESNNHVHTIYSFSPYAPAGAALRAREAGLMVVGSVDHDSAAGAAEMAEAARLLGMGAVTGFECRVYLYSEDEIAAGAAPLNDRKLNNPDTAGIAYMTVQGIPASRRDEVAAFLAPIREARLRRTAAMVDGVYQDIVEVLKPGVRENQIVALANQRLYEMGSDQVEAVNAISGERCNPHPHNFTDRLIRPGDQAFFDIIHSYNGYRTCYYRTFAVGKATAAQRDAYTRAREWMDRGIAGIRAGIGTDEVAAFITTIGVLASSSSGATAMASGVK